VKRARLPAAAFSALVVLSGTRAQDPGVEETAAERAEKVAEVLRTAAQESSDPSVLAGIDPRTASAAERRTIRTIRAKRVSIALEDQPIEAALKILREVTGLSFAMSAKAREAAREEGLAVSIALENLSVENVLNLIALQLGEYRFTLRYGVVVLIRAEEYRPRTILRMYDVSDVVRRPRDFPAPRLGLGKEDGPAS
jgi:hypothetical protein